MMKNILLQLSALFLLLALVPSASFAGEGPCPDLEDCPCVMELTESLVNKGWVGIRMDVENGRWTLVEIFPESPAQRAGLQTGDVLLEIEGVPYVEERQEELREIYRSKHPGDSLTYLVEREGKAERVQLELTRMPPKLLALWLGEKILYSYSAVTGEDLGLGMKKPPKKSPKEPADDDGKSKRGDG